MRRPRQHRQDDRQDHVVVRLEPPQLARAADDDPRERQDDGPDETDEQQEEQEVPEIAEPVRARRDVDEAHQPHDCPKHDAHGGRDHQPGGGAGDLQVEELRLGRVSRLGQGGVARIAPGRLRGNRRHQLLGHRHVILDDGQRHLAQRPAGDALQRAQLRRRDRQHVRQPALFQRNRLDFVERDALFFKLPLEPLEVGRLDLHDQGVFLQPQQAAGFGELAVVAAANGKGQHEHPAGVFARREYCAIAAAPAATRRRAARLAASTRWRTAAGVPAPWPAPA